MLIITLMLVYCAHQTSHHTAFHKIIPIKTVWFGREEKERNNHLYLSCYGGTGAMQ